MGRNHNKAGRARKEATLYSESEEYDDTDTSGGETSGLTTSLRQSQQPIPPDMQQNIFSTPTNMHPGRDPMNTSSTNARMTRPPLNGAPLPPGRQQAGLNNQQPDPSKRQNGGVGAREGVVMGERSLLTNRITNFHNNTGGGGVNVAMMNNNQQHRLAVNSALNNLNTHFSNNSSSSGSSSSGGVVGANNLLGANSSDYRTHLNL